MKKNKINLRTCIITKQKLLKDCLIRFVIINNQAFIDTDRNLLGRGFYIKNDVDVINKLLNEKILEKRFKIKNANDFYEQLKKC